MSTNKEPMCFVGPAWKEGLERYAQLFERHAPIRGESSTAYTSYPYAPEVPERVRATIPDAKLVYLVRDPIPRTLSHYAQNVWDKRAPASFGELMDDLEGERNMPVWCSRYATQLERWLEHFPRERFLVVDERELRRQRVAVIRRVLAFLGADPAFVSPAWSQEHNTARRHHRAPNRLARALGKRGIDAAKWGRLPWLLTTEVGRARPTRAQRRRLAALLRDEAERFHALTGLPVDHWTL
jgi:hypothetical protein